MRTDLIKFSSFLNHLAFRGLAQKSSDQNAPADNALFIFHPDDSIRGWWAIDKRVADKLSSDFGVVVVGKAGFQQDDLFTGALV